jgi:hypothetical protein
MVAIPKGNRPPSWLLYNFISIDIVYGLARSPKLLKYLKNEKPNMAPLHFLLNKKPSKVYAEQ